MWGRNPRAIDLKPWATKWFAFDHILRHPILTAKPKIVLELEYTKLKVAARTEKPNFVGQNKTFQNDKISHFRRSYPPA